MTDSSQRGLSGMNVSGTTGGPVGPRVQFAEALRRLRIQIARVRRAGKLTAAERQAIEELLSALDQLVVIDTRD